MNKCDIKKERKVSSKRREQKNPIELFMRHVNPVKDENGCMNWTGAEAGSTKNKNKYGNFTLYDMDTRKQKWIKAHRFSYEYFIGKVPDGYSVCHRCDNTLCVNPEHLFVGTTQDNLRDMWQKERAKHNKLTNQQVLEIYFNRKGQPASALAKEFGVTPTTIYNIKTQKAWAWLTNNLPKISEIK
jgi:hypothetical protein